jgi:hypothetical protein
LKSRQAETQRNRGKTRQESIELAGVIGREHAGKQIVVGIVDRQARLHASQPLVAVPEQLERPAQLIGVRRVFGVIHNGENATRKRQRHIERFRLGARTDGRRDDDLEGRTEPKPC